MTANQCNLTVQALTRRYERSLGVKLEVLRARWKAARGGHWHQAAGEGLRTLVHQLAGSAASFGLTSIGAAAADLDEHFQIIDAGEQTVDFPDARSVVLFAALCLAIEQERRRLDGTGHRSNHPS